VPSNVLSNWVSFQTNQANSWAEPAKTAPAYTQYDEDFTQAYRLYLLALAGKSGEVMGAMNKLRTNRGDKMTGIGRWQLAAAYALAGQKDVAKALVASAVLDIPVTKIHERAYSFGSAYRDQALLLHTLSVMDEREKANSLLKTICTRLSSNDWMSTQETSQALIAVAKYASRETGLKLSLEYRVDGNNWVKINSNRPIWQQNLDGEKSAKIEVRNTNGVPVYPRIIAQGIPAAGQETEFSKGLQLTVKYVDQTGKELSPKSIPQSTNFTAIATVKNLTGNDLNELALSQIFPSGWEVLNMRLMDGVNPGDAPEFQDQRDDRVYTFFDMKKGGSKTFKMLLNATYAGRYYLPAASVESMYDISNTARLKGEWVEVVKK
jgi:alpha-2-macroglobulin